MKKLTTICVALVLLGCVAPAVAARNPTRAEHAGIDRAFAHLVRHGVGCRLSYVRVSTVDPSWAAGPAHCRIPRKPLFHVVFHKSSREWRVVEWGVGPVFCNPALKAVILDALPHVCPRLEEEAREERASADHERTQAEYLASPAGACWGASHYASGEAEPEGSDAIYIGVQRAGPEYECEWVSVGAGVAWEGHSSLLLFPPKARCGTRRASRFGRRQTPSPCRLSRRGWKPQQSSTSGRRKRPRPKKQPEKRRFGKP